MMDTNTMWNLARAGCAGAALLTLASCGTMKRMVDAIPVPAMPDIAMPKLSSVTKIIPGLGGEAKPEDPVMPFNSKGVLGYGHTLKVQVFDGARTPKELFEGEAMVDERGVLTLGDIGSAKVGGRSLPESRAMIGSVFRSAGRVAAHVHVHIIAVEGVELVSVEGDVTSPIVTPRWDDMTVADAITMAGGRKIGSPAQAVYVTREGQRRFYSSAARANDEASLRAGDIITLSPDL